MYTLPYSLHMYRFNYLPQHRVKVSIIMNVLLWFHLITVRPASVSPLIVGDKELFLLIVMSFGKSSAYKRPLCPPCCFLLCRVSSDHLANDHAISGYGPPWRDQLVFSLTVRKGFETPVDVMKCFMNKS